MTQTSKPLYSRTSELRAPLGNEGVHKSEIINFPQYTVLFSSIFMTNMQLQSL